MSQVGTQVAIPLDIPAHIRALAEKAADQNKSAMGGIKAGSFPRISIGGSKFSIVENGEKVLLTDPDKPDLPAMQLELVVVGYNPHVSKLYYEGEYEEGSDKEPTCSADNGATPDPHITSPQAAGCANCPQNVWGSKVTKQGKQVKACSDNKRLVVIPAHDIENEQALDFTIKPASLKTWAEYVRALDSKGIPVDAVVTKVQFDPSATFPKLVFKFGRFLTETEMAAAALRAKGDDVRLIASPRATTATGPVIPVQPVPVATPAPRPAATPAPAPVAPTPPPAAAPAPAPTAPAAPVAVDPYAGQPPHVKPSVEAAGGLTSDAGKQVYKALTGKDVPAPATEPEKAVDPFEGQPPHVKPSVEAAGGLTSAAGQQVYKALTGKDAPGATPTPTPAKGGRTRTSGKKTGETPPPPAPPAPTPAAAAAATGFATPPASNVAGQAGLGGDLEALLASAMSTPAPAAK